MLYYIILYYVMLCYVVLYDKAEIHLSEDEALIPFVKMGVEAREQVLKDGKAEDAALSRPNHPLAISGLKRARPDIPHTCYDFNPSTNIPVSEQTNTPFTPEVKYAEQFTHNFDLIAERKSVIYHLREMAKASVLAKYLVDSGYTLYSIFYMMYHIQYYSAYTNI